MKIIYHPKGRAAEYGSLAANLRRGCTHGCVYCYVPAVLRIARDKFHAASKPIPAALRDFAEDCRTLAALGNTDPIHLSFTCDPYTPEDIQDQQTRQALQAAHRHGQTVNVLTKGGARAQRDFDLLGKGDIFGVTLTCRNNWCAWEPGAASPDERIESLMIAHDLGVRTRVSFEPVLDAGETMELIRTVRPFADLIQVGKLNVHRDALNRVAVRERAIHWSTFARQVRSLLEDLGGEYYLKADLARLLGTSETLF
jgi:DNA repair photolyase